MKKAIFIFLLVLWGGSSFAQISIQNIGGVKGGDQQEDLDKDKKSSDQLKAPIADYKIISVYGDTTVVDTSLTIQKDYAYNYLRRDNFGLLPYSNIGQTYTELTRSYAKLNTLPQFGARATSFFYYDVEDIYYYHVPTPYTDLMFKTTFKQGQLLDAFFTVNLTPGVNFSVAYKGLHSLGKYRHLLTKQGSFRATFSYQSENGRYGLDAHFLAQDLMAEQNGGLTDLANEQFRSKSAQFKDRELLDVKFEDAERMFRPKRFFVKHHFNVIPGDSTGNNRVQLGHIFNFTDKEYYYKQGSAYAAFGTAYRSSDLRDLTEFQRVANTAYATYQNNLLGKIGFRIRHANYNYGYQRALNLESEVIPNRLKGNIVTVGGTYKKEIAGFDISGDAELNIAGDWEGNYLKAKAGYQLDSLSRVEAGISTNSHRPNYNFMLFQSDYKNYNWFNDFENVQQQRFHFRLKSEKWADVDLDYTRIHNYAYFELQQNPDETSAADTLVRPYQYDHDVNYFRIKAHRGFKFGKFGMDHTLMYQEVVKGKEVFRVPSFITRNSIFYNDQWFHRNMFVQTGFTLNYFDDFYADGYDPVLADFYVQDKEKLQGFARLDFFFNAKVKTARIFFKLENLTTLLDHNGHYASPHQPYRDWVIRFGLNWDFFW